MAERKLAVPENVPGPFFVDNSCVDCDMCRNIAPEIFVRNDDEGYTYVRRQPVTPEEWNAAEDGRSSCPTESIGRDGPPLERTPATGE
jgi:ferredoxin